MTHVEMDVEDNNSESSEKYVSDNDADGGISEDDQDNIVSDKELDSDEEVRINGSFKVAVLYSFRPLSEYLALSGVN